MPFCIRVLISIFLNIDGSSDVISEAPEELTVRVDEVPRKCNFSESLCGESSSVS